MSDNLILDANTFEDKKIYAEASKEKRFLNYIIDILVYSVTSIVLPIVFYWMLSILDIESSLETNSIGRVAFTKTYFINYSKFWGLAFLAVFYTFQEYFFEGKTLGKYFTKTRAIREDNQVMTFSNVLIRSLCRCIPIDSITFLFTRGWHDQFSKTKVIQE